MRFLQIEWHNHERARNAWDIERAEMKAKIAKQEGECRHAKRINEQLERQIRMLEVALKNERAKKRPAADGSGTSTDAQTDSSPAKGAMGEVRPGMQATKRAHLICATSYYI